MTRSKAEEIAEEYGFGKNWRTQDLVSAVNAALEWAAEQCDGSQCQTWCDACNCRAADCGCDTPPYRRHGVSLAARIRSGKS